MRLFPDNWSSVRDRGGGLLFALGLNALLLLALLTMAPRLEQREEDPRNPVTFEMAPAPKAAKKPEARKSEKRAPEKRKQRQAPARQVVRPPEKTPEDQPPILPFLVMSRDQMASADIGRMPKSEPAGPPSAASGQGDSAAVAGPGEGPGGVQLFDAEWYRRPSHAELSPYLPTDAPAQGWGLVACKTIDNYHVDNCQALGESPMGSGFARAVRLAAWQFLVLPPRVNGKVMIGSWVRIRIDYTRRVEGGSGAGS